MLVKELVKALMHQDQDLDAVIAAEFSIEGNVYHVALDPEKVFLNMDDGWVEITVR